MLNKLPSTCSLLPGQILCTNTHAAKRYVMQDIMIFHWCQWKWQTHFALLQEMSLQMVTCFLAKVGQYMDGKGERLAVKRRLIERIKHHFTDTHTHNYILLIFYTSYMCHEIMAWATPDDTTQFLNEFCCRVSKHCPPFWPPKKIWQIISTYKVQMHAKFVLVA